MYNKTEEKPIGKKRVQVVNPRNGRKDSVKFVVVKGKGKPLLGLRASEQTQLVAVVRQNIMAIQSEEPSQSKTPLTTESILKEYADVLSGEGKLEGDLHLEMCDCAWTLNHLTKPSNAITTRCRQSRMSFLSSQMQDALQY